MRTFAWLVAVSLFLAAMACSPAAPVAPDDASQRVNGEEASQCGDSEEAAQPEEGDEAPQRGDSIGGVTGTIIYLPLEGGFWGIRGDDGVNYLPFGLPRELQHEGLRAEFQLEILWDVATFQQWGTPARVRGYNIIEPG